MSKKRENHLRKMGLYLELKIKELLNKLNKDFIDLKQNFHITNEHNFDFTITIKNYVIRIELNANYYPSIKFITPHPDIKLNMRLDKFSFIDIVNKLEELI